MRSSNILYVSATGLLQPLGYSQVVRVVKGLAALGWRYHVVSLERAQHLADADAVSRMRAELDAVGVGWTALPYRDAARNVATLTRVVLSMAARFDLVHARSYQPALAALAAKLAYRTPYLFDKRGYWIDEKRDEGRWFTRPSVYAAAKRLERALFMQSAGVVSLSRHGVDDVRDGVFGPWPKARPAVNIPTCVDYRNFTIEDTRGAVPEWVDQRLEGKLVVGYIGSINRSYKVERMCDLFARLSRIDPRAHLLGLTGQPEELAELLAARGVDVDADATITRAPHADMPSWMTRVDWGLMLLNSTYPKRASMPTKLAEFFAAGVRPVQLGCNDDVSEWVERAATGVALRDASDAELDRAASLLAASPRRAEHDASLFDALEKGRSSTWSHFSLEQGVARYDELLTLLSRRTGAE